MLLNLEDSIGVTILRILSIRVPLSAGLEFRSEPIKGSSSLESHVVFSLLFMNIINLSLVSLDSVKSLVEHILT
jgi:hypothetical protein